MCKSEVESLIALIFSGCQVMGLLVVGHSVPLPVTA